MKTNYHPRNKAPTDGRKRVVVVFGILIGGIVVFSLFCTPLTSIFSPLWKSNIFSHTFGGVTALIRSKESLQNENATLQAEINADNTVLLSSRAIEDSRDQILAEFNRASTTAGIASSVLVHPPETPYDVLIIDAGTSDGVAVGDRVSLPTGGSIGSVSTVSNSNARVTLYTASGNKTDAVLERNSLPVTLVGQGGGNFEFDLPKGVPVVAGDKILSANIRSEMIAVVGDVVSDPTDSLEHVHAQSIANVFSIRFVLVKP